MPPRSTKEHILLATIEAIEKVGLTNLTTRAIAQEAGVNNAALHYYYGTKERLVEAALAQTLAHMLEDSDALLAVEEPIAERLLALLDYLAQGVVGWPNVIRAHLLGPVLEGQLASPFAGLMERWLDRTARAIQPEGDDGGVRVALHAAFSALLLAGLMPTPHGFTPADLRDPAARQEYLGCLVGMILRAREG